MTLFGDLFVSIRNGLNVRQTQGASGLPITRIETISSGSIDACRVGYADLDEVDSKWILRPGDLLFSHINSPKHVGRAAIYDGSPAPLVHGMNLLSLRPDRRVLDPSYALQLVRSPGFRSSLLPFINKAVNQASISITNLSGIEVTLPPPPTQRRIAEILGRADAIRAKRRQTLARLDALTLSIFHDMFGNPMTNDRSLPLAAIGDIAQVVTGNSPSRRDGASFGDDIEWIKSDNLGCPIASRAEEWLSEHGRARARTAPPGSILVTCIAGSPTSIGKASMVDREVAFNQQINAILPSPLVDSSFLLGQLKTAPELVRSKSTGGMKGLVSKSSFQSIEVLAPPLAAQREFAARVAALGIRQVSAQSAMAFADELFASLQAQAFDGRL